MNLRYTKLCLLAFVSITCHSSCFANSVQNTDELKLTWFDGLTLDRMLDTEIASNNSENLAKQLITNWYDAFEIQNPSTNTDKHSIKTCNEFFLAAQNHLQPVNEKDAIPYMELGMMCHAVKTVVLGKDATSSHLGKFKLNK